LNARRGEKKKENVQEGKKGGEKGSRTLERLRWSRARRRGGKAREGKEKGPKVEGKMKRGGKRG